MIAVRRKTARFMGAVAPAAVIAALLELAAIGAATAGPVTTQPPAGDPAAGLVPFALARFDVGREAFDREFIADEGLGPIFNHTSCGGCHLSPLGGPGVQRVTLFAGSNKGGFDPLEELGGPLLQIEAIVDECREDVPPEATLLTDRVTSGMMGYGLVEAIPDCAILAVRDGQAASIQGTASFVVPLETNPRGEPCGPGPLRVGRFGWKAQHATVLGISARECVDQIGLTSQLVPQDNDPNGVNPPSLGDPDFCDTVADPEDDISFGNGANRDFVEVVTDFQRYMAGPPQTPRSGMTGEDLFASIGCSGCHHPSYTTLDDTSVEAGLRNRVIRPYGDFLLHTVGLNGDGFSEGDASGIQIRTAPLWGLIHHPALWHDGRFDNGAFEPRVADAVNAHDDGVGLSQGEAAAQAFAALSVADRSALMAFLGSLGRREFDVNLDNQVTITDFHFFGDSDAFKACLGGGPYTADDVCAIHDVDQDQDVDLDDFDVFLSVYDGALTDCNANTILDLFDILDGTSADDDHNGLPDECSLTCPGDLDLDGAVGITEFLMVLGTWGPCAGAPDPCPADFNVDGVVGILDFLFVLGGWGACP